MSDDRTFTVQEIIDATLDHHRGCLEGKHEFLRDAFAIEPNANWEGEYIVTCTAYIRVRPGRIHAADMRDEEGLALTVEDFIDHQFRAENLSDNVTGVDMIDGWEIEVARPPEPVIETPSQIVNELGQRTAMDLQ